MLASATVLAPTPVMAASPGCIAVNGGGLDQLGTPLIGVKAIVGTFYTGEVLSMTYSSSAVLPLSVITMTTTGLLRLSTSLDLALIGTGPVTRTITITGTGATGAETNLVALGALLGVTIDLRVRCAGVAAPTTTALATSANPSVVGQNTTFTAQVSAPAGSGQTPNGNVTFTINGTNFGPVALNASGIATYSTSALSPGTATITATYAGNSNFVTSAFSGTQTVTAANTTTGITASANPTFGGATTFTATVAAVAPGGGTPTGNVIFTINGADQSPVALSGGTATLTRSDLAVGASSVAARYVASTNYNASSGTLSGGVTVAAATTTTTVTQSSASSPFGDPVTFRAQVASNGGQPTGNVVFTVDGVARSPVALSSGAAELTLSDLAVGNHTVSAAYQGVTGYGASNGTLSGNHAITTRTTTTTLSGPGPIQFGGSATITATVAGAGGPPTGTVVFLVDGQAQPAATLSSSTASITLPGLTVGNHTVSAVYSGAPTFAAGGGTLTGGQSVTAATTALGVAASPGTGLYGGSSTFTASVTSAAGVPAGDVVFTVDGVAQAPVTLSGGTASLTSSTLSVGTHTVSASYQGNSSFLASNGSLASAYTVDRAVPSVAVSSSADPSVIGQSVQLTASVTAAAGTPGGTVTFTVDGTPLPAATLSGGSASVTLPALALGDHTVSVRYSGDSNFVERTSTLSGGQKVNPGNTALTISTDSASAAYGVPVTVSANLVAAAPAAGNPAGQVVFLVDGVAQSPVTVSGGRAQLLLDNLAPGNHTVSAGYQGSSDFNASTASLSGGVTVTKAATTTSIALDNATIAFGQTARVTATVAGASGRPSGEIVYTINGVARPAVALQDGTTSLDLSNLAAGNYAISASYGGSANHVASASGATQLTVSPAATQLGVTASAQTVRFGDSITLSAQLTSAGGTPSGSIEFLANGVSIGSAPMTAGAASLTVSSLPFGTAAITARFAGNANFAATTGALAADIAVSGRVPEMSVTIAPPAAAYGQTLTATIAVTSPAGTPGGPVTLRVDDTDYQATLAGGTATISLSGLAPGSHAVSATYPGQSPFLGASASANPVTITRASSTLAISAASTALTFGQSLVLNATVSSGFGTPEGGVIFTIDGNDYPPAALTTGKASLPVSGLTPGQHTVTARYSGSTTHETATASLATSISVAAAATSLGLTSSAASITFGGTVDLVAAITSSATPVSGNVIFSIDGRDYGQAEIASGAARLRAEGLTVGSHTVAARFEPAPGFQASNATLSGGISVTAAPVSVSVTMSQASPTVGIAVPFAIAITSTAGTPTGQVIPVVDGVDQPAVTLVDGQASFERVFTRSGNHTVSVRYPGSESFAAGNGALQGGLVVAGAASTVTLSASPAAPVFGQPVTVSASVAATFGTPTGLVIFTRGGATIATVPLTNGVATTTLGDLSADATTITATYQGDTGRLGASSSITLDPTDAPTTISVTANPATAFVGAPVTFTATISSPAGPVPGSIGFVVDGTDFPATISNGVATLTVNDLREGTYEIYARFYGEPGFAPSETQLATDLVVEPAPTTIQAYAQVPRSVAGEPLTIAITAAGGRKPYIFTVPAGALPDGLALDTLTGVISGTPTTPGSYSFTVTAANAALIGTPGDVTVNLVVLEPATLVLPGTLAAGIYAEDYSADLSVSGGTAPYQYVLSGTLPQGVTFDAATATLSGTPTALGGFPLSLTVTDANGFTATRAYTLTIAAPTLSITTELPSAGAFVPYEGQVSATGGTGPYSFAVTQGALPDGLILDAESGAITGTPRIVGTTGFTVTATDANGFAASLPIALEVEQVFTVLLPRALADARQFRPYGQVLAATGGTAPYAYEITTGALPDGLSLDEASGAITGAATEFGSFAFTLTATDANGIAGAVDYTLAVAEAATLVPDADLPEATAGLPYEQVLSVTGGSAPYSFALISGTLPDGLDFDAATGTISGTATTDGTFPLVIQISDANGDSITQSYLVTVAAPQIDVSIDLPPAEAGAPFESTVTVTGGAQPLTFALTGTLPVGLTFDPATGAISGVPTQVGSFPITLTAADANGYAQSAQATIAVTAETTLLLSASAAAVTFGDSVELTAEITSAAGNIAGSVVFSLDGNDYPGVALDNGTARLVIDGLTVGSHTVAARFEPAGGFLTSTAELPGGIDVTAAAVSIAIDTEQAQPVAGIATPFSVAVTSPAGTPPGQVIPVIDGVDQPTVTLVDGQAVFEATFTSAGSHTVSVRYTGSESFAAITGTLAGGIVVTGAASDVAVSVDPAAPIFGQPVTISATVTSAFGTPTGLVVFTRDGVELGSVPLADGVASLTLTNLPPGSNAIIATYAGDAARLGAEGSLAFELGDAATELTLTASPNTIYAGAPVTFTATVSSDAGAVPGSVVFVIGDTEYSAGIDGGIATLTVTDLPEGTYPISVRFDGQPGFAPAEAPLSADFVVEPTPTDIQVSALAPRSVAGESLAIAVTATGGVAPYTFAITDGALPDGVELDPATGAIVGTPTLPGSYSFTITASGAAGAPGSVAVDLVVLAPAELVIPETIKSGSYGVPFSVDLAASGGTEPYQYALTGSLPRGIAFDAATATLSGTPTALGTFALSLTVTDANGFTVTRDYDLAIAPPTLVVTADLPTAGAFVPYAGQISVTGVTGPYSFWITDGALPDGMSIDAATGAITGTPRIVGDANFTVTALDSNGFAQNLSVTLTVEQVFTVVLPDTLADARQFRPYGQALAATGGTAPYTYAITSGALPADLTLDTATGTISGIPSEFGNFAFALSASDANGVAGSVAYTLAVAQAATLVPETALEPATAGIPYSQTLSVSGGAEPYGFSLVSGRLPDGLSFDAATGTLSGTATEDGAFPLVIQIADANGDTVTQSYLVTVLVPQIDVVINLPPAQAGQFFESTVTVTGGSLPLSFTLGGSLPDGFAFDATTGAISGTTTQVGTFPISITATDANGYEQTAQAAIIVTADTTLSLSASTQSPVFGDSVELTAEISTSAEDIAGTVVFIIDGVEFSGVSVVDGAARLLLDTLTVGDHSIAARFDPAPGFIGSSAQLDGGIQVVAASVSISLAAPQGQVTVGQQVQFSVSVTSPAGVPGGQVIPVIDGIDLSAVSLTDGEAVFDYAFATSGSHTVSVRYPGSESFASDSGVLAGGLSVAGAASELTLSATPDPPVFGQTVTVTATLTSSVGTPTGLVTFTRDGVEIGSVALVDGVATLSIENLAAGSNTITASYQGDTALAGTEGTLTLELADAATTLALSASSTGIYAGAPVTFTATLGSDAGAVPGSVVFTIGDTEYPVVIDNGLASLTLTDLPEGNHAVSARYDGQPGFAASQAALDSDIVVAPAPTDIEVYAQVPRSVAGEALDIAITATGGVGPYAFAVTDGTLPDGVSLDPQTGAISGTPLVSGDYSFTVTASGTAGAAGNVVVALSVLEPAILVIPGTVEAGTYGVALTADLSASGGTTPYQYVLSSDLPQGVEFDAATATLSGTPTALGRFDFSLAVTDANGFTLTRDFELVVAAPIITVTADLPPAGAFVDYAGQIAASGGSGSYSFSVSQGALPDGLSLDPGTGAITGTPRIVGDASFTVTATDGNGFATSIPVTLVVEQVFTIVLPDTLADARQFRPYGQTLTATGGTAPYAYAIMAGALPQGLTFDTESGIVTGTPTEAGSFGFTLTATDANGVSGSLAYTLVVAQAATLVPDTSLAPIVAGVPYTQTLEVSGGTAPYSFALISGSLPPGFAFDAGSATLSGTATAAGTFPLVIEIRDANGDSITQSYPITVLAPQIVVTLDIPAAQSGEPFASSVTVSGGAQPLRFAIDGTLPAGLAFDTASGAISGTPTEAGSFPITIIVIDANGFEQSAQAVIEIAEPVEIVFGGIALTAIAGEAYSQSITASGGVAPYSFALSAGQLPPGITFDATSGTLSGTPSEPGSFNFTLSVEDSEGHRAEQSFTVTIAAPAFTPTFPTGIPAATGGTAYTASIAVTGPAPLAYAVSAGSLPAGLTLDAETGEIRGTPTEAGDFAFEITVTDGFEQTATVGYTLSVAAPELTAGAALPAATGGVAYNASLDIGGGTGPYRFTLTSSLPEGLQFDADTGTLSGTPTEAGSFVITIQVSDANGFGNEVSFPLTIAAPVLEIQGNLPAARVGLGFDFTPVLSGGTPDYAFSIAAGSLPDGLVLDAATGQISGTPRLAANAGFTLAVTDAYGFSVERTFTLNVATNLGEAQLPDGLGEGQVGVAYTGSAAATGGSQPLSYAVSAGSLPPGLTLNSSSGALEGTPEEAGTWLFTITVTDSDNLINAQQYTVSIEPPALEVSNDFPNAVIGQDYHDTVTVSGGREPYSFAMSNAPRDLTIDAQTGVISGIPRQAGSFDLVITVTDASGHMAQHEGTLIVERPPIALLLRDIAADGVTGTAYFSSVAASNGVGAVRYEVTRGSLPPGLTFSELTGELTGTPTATGTFNFTIGATDADSNVGTRSYALAIAAGVVPDASADIAVNLSASEVRLGGNVRIEVTVSTATGPAGGGSVSLVDVATGAVIDSTVVGTSGTALFSIVADTVGDRTLLVQYSGTRGIAAGESAPVTFGVLAATTLMVLDASPDAPLPGDEVELTATIEREAPAAGAVNGGTVTFLLDGQEIATVPVSGGTAVTTVTLPAGSNAITARFEPADANDLASDTALTIAVAGEAEITLSGPQGEVAPETPLTYTALVTPASPGDPEPTGTVSFQVGSEEVANVPLADGAASATLDALPAGTYQVTAVYSGDVVYPELTSEPIALTIAAPQAQPLATTTALTPSSATPVVGDAVTLTATVTGGQTTPPTGLVRFIDQTTGTGIGTGTLNGMGQATLLHRFTTADSKTIVAAYQGDALNLASADQMVFNVVPSPTQITLQASTEVVGPNETTLLTAEFSREPEGRGPPRVEVIEFRADDVVFASVPVDGATSVSVESPAIGMETGFTAKLVPEAMAATDMPSVSNLVVVELAAAAETTDTTLTISPNPSTEGATVTLTATVTSTSTPDGDVRFTRNGTVLGTVTLVGGSASLPVSTLPAGSYPITADYLGSALFSPSGDTETATVTPPAGVARLTLSGQANPNIITAAGQPVSLTFQVGAVGGPISGIALAVPGASGVTCPLTALADGQSMTCSATYTASFADIAQETISITATVTGTGVDPASTTVTLASRANEVVESFEDLTNQFMATRARMVTGIALPDIFDRRTAPGGNRLGSVNAQSSSTSQTYQFATSLEQLRGFANNQPGNGPRVPLEPSPFNAWVDMRVALHGSDTDAQQWSRLGVAAAGVDFLVNDNLLVGIAAQGDWMIDHTAQSEFTGVGYLVGPYASLALSDNLSLDLALFYGQSSNEATSTVGGVSYTGSFETDRLLASAGLSGFYEIEDFILRPSATFFLSSESSGAYTVSDANGLSVPIPSQDILDLQLRGGLTIERAIELENGATLTPMVGLNLTYGGTLNDNTFEDRITGGIMGGLLYDSGDFSVKGSVEAEFGTSGFEGVTARISITGKF